MNLKQGVVTEIVIIIWIMTEADVRSPSPSKIEFFVTSVNGWKSLTTVT